MKKILLALLITLFSFASAQAYFISFDQYGTGDDANLVLMDEWSLAVFPEENADAGAVGDIFTYQDLAGNFYEDFTMRLDEGHNSTLTFPGSLIDFNPDLYVDVHLEGTYYNDTNIVFSGGFIQVYKEGDATIDGNFDLGTDIDIATLNLTNALTSSLSGSLLGTEDLGMKVDLNFEFLTVNDLFWGETEEELADKGWLLSVVGGRIDMEELYNIPGDYPFLIEWDSPDFQAEFNVVPEPSTFILLGAGIAGLAFYRRRK